MNAHFSAARRRLTLLALLGGALAAPAVRADRDDGPDDHELARQALERGEILPLRAVLDRVEREFQGQVLKIEFERDDGRFIYEIRLLQDDGRIVKLKVDAVDGHVLGFRRREERDAHSRRRR